MTLSSSRDHTNISRFLIDLGAPASLEALVKLQLVDHIYGYITKNLQGNVNMRLTVNFGDFPARIAKCSESFSFTRRDIMQLTNDDLRFLYGYYWKNTVAEFSRNFQVNQLRFASWLEKKNSCPSSENAVRAFLVESGFTNIGRTLEQHPTLLQLAILMGSSKVARFLAEDLGADILNIRIPLEDSTVSPRATSQSYKTARRSPSPRPSTSRSPMLTAQHAHAAMHRSQSAPSSQNHSPVQQTSQLTHHLSQSNLISSHPMHQSPDESLLTLRRIDEADERNYADQLSTALVEMSPLVLAISRGNKDTIKMLLNLLEQRKEEDSFGLATPGRGPDADTTGRTGSAARFVQWTGTKTLLPGSFKPQGIYIDDAFCALSCESSSEEDEIAMEHADYDGSHSDDKDDDTSSDDISTNASNTQVIINNEDAGKAKSATGSSGKNAATTTTTTSTTATTSTINDNDNNDISSIPTKFLLQIYDKALLQAVASGQDSIAQQLLDFGADPNFQCSLPLPGVVSSSATGVSSYSCLSLSVQRKMLKLVQLLLDYGANPLAPDPLGRSPIHIASKFGENNEIFKVLINKISYM